jgi:nicotinic acid mononucleotide adenylyltransferase
VGRSCEDQTEQMGKPYGSALAPDEQDANYDKDDRCNKNSISHPPLLFELLIRSSKIRTALHPCSRFQSHGPRELQRYVNEKRLCGRAGN